MTGPHCDDFAGTGNGTSTVVLLTESLKQNINRAMEELAALGSVHPYLLADGTIELRPSPASPELAKKVAEIFERAGVRELRPWVWGVGEADKGD